MRNPMRSKKECQRRALGISIGMERVQMIAKIQRMDKGELSCREIGRPTGYWHIIVVLCTSLPLIPRFLRSLRCFLFVHRLDQSLEPKDRNID